MKTNVVIVIISLFFILLLSGCKQQICRDIQVPYEDIEYYTESESYVDETCIPKFMDGELGKFYEFNGEEMETTKTLTVINEETRNEPIKYYVENFENRAGTFEVYALFMEKCDGGYCGLTSPSTKPILIDTFKVNANSRKIAYFYIDSILDKIPAGADAILLDEDGEEYQDCGEVTKYRNVEKSRTVTKYRTETRCE